MSTKAMPGTAIKIKTKVNGEMVKDGFINKLKYRYQQGCLVCRIFMRIAYILGAGALSGYLLLKYKDPVVIVVGAMAGIFSLYRLVVLAYKAER